MASGEPTLEHAQDALASVAKHFIVRCVCGSQMTIKHPRSTYHSSASWCDGCQKNMSSAEYSYHCPKRGTSNAHPSGYDYCFQCAVDKYQLQRKDKLSTELDIIVHSKHNLIDNNNVSKIMLSLQSLQCKQLELMQAIHHMMTTHNDSNDADEVKQDASAQQKWNHLGKLQMSQSVLHENINALQSMQGVQKSMVPLTTTLLSKHCALMSDWKQWTQQDVIHWFITVDNGEYKQYAAQFRQWVAKENVKGSGLQWVDGDALIRCGVMDIEKRNKLLLSLKTLLSQTVTNDDQTAVFMSTDGQYAQPEGQ